MIRIKIYIITIGFGALITIIRCDSTVNNKSWSNSTINIIASEENNMQIQVKDKDQVLVKVGENNPDKEKDSSQRKIDNDRQVIIKKHSKIKVNDTHGTYVNHNIKVKLQNKSKNRKQHTHQVENTDKDQVVKADLSRHTNVLPWSYFFHNEKVYITFKKQIIDNGLFKLFSLASVIYNETNITIDRNEHLDYAANTYQLEVESYFDLLSEKIMLNRLEEEYQILDVLDSVDKIFASQYRLLIDKYETKINKSKRQFLSSKLSKIASNVIFHAKKKNLKYACKHFSICKDFPAYSDYLAELLNEMQKLPDDKLQEITEYLTIVMKSKARFFEAIMDKDVIETIIPEFTVMAKSMAETRKFLSTFNKVLVNRWKIFKNVNGTVNYRAMALRMYIDMVDNVYGIMGELYTKYDFENIRKAILNLRKGKKIDFKRTISSYCDNIEDIIMFYWTPDVREESKILTRVILFGIQTMDSNYDYLFSEGSKLNKFLHEIELYEKLPHL